MTLTNAIYAFITILGIGSGLYLIRDVHKDQRRMPFAKQLEYYVRSFAFWSAYVVAMTVLLSAVAPAEDSFFGEPLVAGVKCLVPSAAFALFLYALQRKEPDRVMKREMELNGR